MITPFNDTFFAEMGLAHEHIAQFKSLPGTKNKAQVGKTCAINLVAEMGLEPHDLRVMSPTSYQLLYSAS